MDPNSLVLDISSDEEDDYNWFAELFGDEVVVPNDSLLKKSKMKEDDDDDDDDCMVLDYDPNNNEGVEVRNHDPGGGDDDSDDVLVVREKGQVACRDYPHSRHLCIKFPFSSAPNQSHCNQCYCYVCDSLAPCVYWGDGTATTDHCHATDKVEFWILERKTAKNGGKVIQPVTQPAPALAQPQPQYQYPNPGLIHAPHTPTNFFQYSNVPGQYRTNLLASRNKLHPALASPLVLRAHQKYNPGMRVHRPVFKRTGSVRVATTANQNPGARVHGQAYKRTGSVRVATTANQNPCRGISGNRNSSIGSLQPNAVKTRVQYPSRSLINTPSTVNHQPLLRQLQVSGHSNPSFQSRVKYNPITETIPHQQPCQVPPLPFRPEPTSSQPSYLVPSMPFVNTPVVPNLDLTHNSSQGNQAQGSTGLKDSGLGGVTHQDSTNSLPLAGGLADYQYDWIFDDQPIEPGFTDYSSDYAFIDTGPIFDF